jgi:hypothetical protein
MTRIRSDVIEVAEAALAAQQSEMAASLQRQLQAVTAATSTGSGDINAAFSLDVRFRLVFVRCHFVGTLMRAPLSIVLDAAQGSTHDATLFVLKRAGPGRDVNFRIGADENEDPSAWTFQTGDAVRVQWTNPDPGNIAWGLQVGLAMAN